MPMNGVVKILSAGAPAKQEPKSVLLPLLLNSFGIRESHKDVKLIMV